MRSFRLTTAVVLLGCLGQSAGSQEQVAFSRPITLNSPDGKWSIAADLPGFQIEFYGLKEDGRRYLFANNAETGVVFSATLEKSPGLVRPTECLDAMKRRAQDQSQLKKEGIQIYDTGPWIALEYVVPGFQGMALKQGNLFLCQVKDNTYVDIHLSKVKFAPEDGGLFAPIVTSVHFQAPSGPGVFDYLGEGSKFYLERNYKKAISPYSKALELEKTNPLLNRVFFRVLIDNLGMAYGISGDLKSAKEIFEFGLTRDSKYPLFHYNLACTYAEMKDIDKAIASLKTAFEYKDNQNPGESMPDPRGDDSFKPYLKNEKFKEALKNLGLPVK